MTQFSPLNPPIKTNTAAAIGIPCTSEAQGDEAAAAAKLREAAPTLTPNRAAAAAAALVKKWGSDAGDIADFAAARVAKAKPNDAIAFMLALIRDDEFCYEAIESKRAARDKAAQLDESRRATIAAQAQRERDEAKQRAEIEAEQARIVAAVDALSDDDVRALIESLEQNARSERVIRALRASGHLARAILTHGFMRIHTSKALQRAALSPPEPETIQ